MIMIQSAARNSRMIFDISPIPNQMIMSGIRAKGGTGRMNSTIGSNQPRDQLVRPIAYPIGMPIAAPSRKPISTR